MVLVEEMEELYLLWLRVADWFVVALGVTLDVELDERHGHNLRLHLRIRGGAA
nr:hypothetical protein [Arthrospira sp. PLM2.Bin9]